MKSVLVTVSVVSRCTFCLMFGSSAKRAKAAIWIAANLHVASDWDAYGVAETIGSGTVNFPRKYLGTAVRNGATEYLEGVAGS